MGTLLVLSWAAAISGCGTSGYMERMEATEKRLKTGGYDSPETAFTAFSDALQQRNWQKVFKSLTAESSGNMTGQMATAAIATENRDRKLRDLLKDFDLTPVNATPPTPGAGADAFAKFRDELVGFTDQLKEKLDTPARQADFFAAITTYLGTKDDEWFTQLPLPLATPLKLREVFSKGSLEEISDSQAERFTGTFASSDEEGGKTAVVFVQENGRWYIDVGPPTGQPRGAADASADAEEGAPAGNDQPSGQ